MNYYIIEDTHFGHYKLCLPEYGNRPKLFNQMILKNLNVIKKEDVLIHIGDFCIGNDVQWHKDFFLATGNCKRWLIRGNHDGKSIKWYLEHGWDFVADNFMMEIYGKRILFSHKPEAGNYDLNIHGHCHNADREKDPEIIANRNDKQLLIKMEHHYKPITLKKLMEGTKANLIK